MHSNLIVFGEDGAAKLGSFGRLDSHAAMDHLGNGSGKTG